ncbi:MAG: tryptophan 2,3-dioxygenase [Alphaproteobacteria bacterium]
MAQNRDLTHQRLADEAFHTDFGKGMAYGDYLDLGRLLAAQNLRSTAHDEMLFIVMHQCSELWMKLMIHELGAAVAHLRNDSLRPAFKMTARVSQIQEQLTQSWGILATMTPTDYLTFRDTLGAASGFQSFQYRTLEFMMGNKDRKYLAPHKDRPEWHDALKAVLEAPSLYDETIGLLARKGFAIDPSEVNRDWSEPRDSNDSVRAAWVEIYSNAEKHWDLYEWAEELVDLEDAFQTWRFRHRTTVERIIGHKRGTGGTSGVGYLKRALEIRFFPELWDARTDL